jgi:Dockerin type I domain
MKENPASKSGFLNSRALLTFVLCSVGALLGMLGVAAPTKPVSGILKPVIRTDSLHGISGAVRDLPIAAANGPRQIEVENGLLRVKPSHPVPAGFKDPARQTSPAAAAAPTPIANFEGQSANDSGCGCIPPDPNGAVGPTQYVAMENSIFSVYGKTTGNRLSGPTQINSLFSGLTGSACADNNNGDPVVVYDRIADRWILSQFAVPGGSVGYHECIAVSQTPDATGQYYVYDFLLSTTKFEDYPHIGLWPDAYYMMNHEFDPTSLSYVGAAVWAFERAKMLAGQPAQMVGYDLGTVNIAFGGHLPASLDGANLPPAGAPGLFAEVDSSTDIPPTAALRIWKFHVDWTTPSNTTFGLNGTGQPNTITPVTDFARPNCMDYAEGCVPQLGDTFQLDPIGDRLMHRVAYRNFGDHEAIVLNHTVVSDSTTGQMGPRWYEVRDPGGTPVIYQQSTFVPTSQTDLLYRWMGSIAMDASGDIAIGYSTSSQASFPSIAYAGRLATDPLNTLAQGETQMFAGGGPEHGELFAPEFGRWGDYTALQVDPTDDCTFWYTNEYFAATDAPTGIWHTRIGSFKFPQCVPPVVPQLVSVVSEKTHGSAGTFDINLPLSGTRGVECRSGGTGEAAGQFTMILTFSTPLASCGSTTGNGALFSGPGPNQCTVNLSRVTNATYVTVTLNGVVSSTGGVGNNFTGTMGVLLGDVNGNGSVDSGDVTLVRQQTLQNVTQSNFREDVTANGSIDSGDVTITRQQTLTSLPSPP